MRSSEAACALAHHYALRTFFNSDDQVAVILEDDIEIKPEVLQRLTKALKIEQRSCKL